MLNRFETIGITLSLVVMVAALWFLSIDKNSDTVRTAEGEPLTDTGPVVIAETDNQRAAVADALLEASQNGDLEKLIVDEIIVGEGDPVVVGDTVTVQYIGTLENGQQFDNSYLKGQPFSFTVGEGRVIKGWEEGIVGMQEGGQRIIVVPSELGYGREGFGPIPGNADLVFAIELISIKKN